MPSKFLVPLEVPDFQGTPSSTADAGYVLLFIYQGWLTSQQPDGTQTDLVLQRPLDGFTSSVTAEPITAQDTVLSAFEKIQKTLSNIRLTGDVTGTGVYNAGELIIETTGLGGIDCTELLNCEVIIDIQGNIASLQGDVINIYSITDSLDTRVTDLENAPAPPFLATEFDNYHFSGYGTEYAVGDIVYYQGHIYQALFNNDGVTPAIGGNTYWADLGTGARLRQIVSDWNATTGEAQILNKPTALSQFTNDAGFITGYTETDPIFSASVAAGITSTDVSNWNDAYSWGNHALAGYLTAETDTLNSVTTRGNSTNNDILLGGSLLVNTTVNAGFRLDVAGYARIFDSGGASVEIYPTPGTYTAFKAATGSGAGPTVEFYGDTGTSLNGIGMYGPDPTYQGMLIYAMKSSVEDIVMLSSDKISLPRTQLIVWASTTNAIDTPQAGIARNQTGFAALEINDGTSGNYADLILNHLTATSLAGSGTRMVVADSSGVLGTQTIPSGGGSGTVTSVALATGTTGTDINVSGSPITGAGTITLNIPNASTSARGVVSITTQSFTGQKTFVSPHSIITTIQAPADGSFGAYIGTTFQLFSNLSNRNLYGERNSVSFELSTYTLSGTATYNATAQHNEVYLSGGAGSTQPFRAMMATLVGNAGKPAMNVSDFRFIEVKTPDNGGVTGHVVTTATGLYINAIKTASSFTITDAYAIRQIGTTDINEFNGLMRFTNYATGSERILAIDGSGNLGGLSYTPVATTRTISTSGPLSGGGDLSANRTFSIAQATTSTDGYLSSTDWNTFNGKQSAITLTTTGTSGPATLVGATLNIPQYAGSGSSSSLMTIAGSATGLAATTTRYGSVSGTTSESQVSTPLPAACTLNNLYVRTTATMNASASLAVTLFKNGSATAVTLTIAGGSAAGIYSDTSNNATYAAGDRWSIEYKNTGSVAAAASSGTSFKITI